MVKHSRTSRGPQSSFGILSLVLNGNRIHGAVGAGLKDKYY